MNITTAPNVFIQDEHFKRKTYGISERMTELFLGKKSRRMEKNKKKQKGKSSTDNVVATRREKDFSPAMDYATSSERAEERRSFTKSAIRGLLGSEKKNYVDDEFLHVEFYHPVAPVGEAS